MDNIGVFFPFANAGQGNFQIVNQCVHKLVQPGCFIHKCFVLLLLCVLTGCHSLRVSKTVRQDLSQTCQEDCTPPVDQLPTQTPSFPEDLGVDCLWCEGSVHWRTLEQHFASLAQHGRVERNKKKLKEQAWLQFIAPVVESTAFDFPVVLDRQVLCWIAYFRTRSKPLFSLWAAPWSGCDSHDAKYFIESGFAVRFGLSCYG